MDQRTCLAVGDIDADSFAVVAVSIVGSASVERYNALVADCSGRGSCCCACEIGAVGRIFDGESFDALSESDIFL